MIMDGKEITAVELARLIELLGGSVENNNTEPFDWISLPGSKTTVSRVESNLLFGVDNDFAILVANRLAALPRKRVGFYVQSYHFSGDGNAFRVSIIDYARPGFARFEADSPNLAEAVLAAAIRWTRAVMAEGHPDEAPTR